MSESKECLSCAGCGQIADDDDKTPWKYWAELPSPANLAVQMGIVTPHTCPSCDGTGVTPSPQPPKPMTKTKRPAEQLAAEIDKQIKSGLYVEVTGGTIPFIAVPVVVLQDWRKLARSIDARMRLDGSRLNKRKSAGAGRKRVTR